MFYFRLNGEGKLSFRNPKRTDWVKFSRYIS